MMYFKGANGEGGIITYINRPLKYVAKEPTIKNIFKLEENAKSLRAEWAKSEVKPMVIAMKEIFMSHPRLMLA